MRTADKNKLIAEFMGGKYDKDTSFPIHPDDIWLPYHGICNQKRLLYHSSWNWLMPVVEKIEALKFTTIFYVNISAKCCKISSTQENSKASDYYSNMEVNYSETNAKLLATYEACFQFIQWYNNNK